MSCQRARSVYRRGVVFSRCLTDRNQEGRQNAANAIVFGRATMSEKNEFSKRPSTLTRYQGLNEDGMLIVVTQAYGPNGESLMDEEGDHLFSGEAAIRLRVRQGDLVDDVLLSPFYGDPSKFSNTEFEPGKSCELFCPKTDTPLELIPGLVTEEGGSYYAIYLTDKLQDGEMVAINDVWGNTSSRILGEGDVLFLLAEASEALDE